MRRTGPWVAAVALLVAGCIGGWRRPERPPRSALWIGAGGPGLDVSDVARLGEVGIGEVFLEVAALAEDGSGLVKRQPPTVPPSTAVTLVVAGKDLPPDETELLAAEIQAELRSLWLELEAEALVPVGVHFDLPEVSGLERYAVFLEQIRDGLDRDALLSVSVPRHWVGLESLESIVDETDFTVAFLYGQRPEEAEDAAAWDFVKLERALDSLERLGKAYLLGVVSLGTAAHQSRGAVLERTTELSLEQLIWNRDLKLQSGFSLEGVNRRVYELRASRSTSVGDWRLGSGDEVRVVRASTNDLEELMRRLGARELPGYRGQLYYRLPRGNEGLSLDLGNLLNAHRPAPATPALGLAASVQRRIPRGWRVRFSIRNDNGEGCALSMVESNYVQVQAKGGSFGKVTPGDFYRYDLFRETANGEFQRTFRRPDVVRLYVPILEGERGLTSGDVELFGRGEPDLLLTASFRLNDGRSLEVGPFAWRGEELEPLGGVSATE